MALYPEEGAALRTDVPTSLGSVPGDDFKVDFQLLYEVHGALDPGGDDNASLLVLRMVPLPRKTDVQFARLRVQLSVELAGADKSMPDEDMPTVESFEPASGGAQYIDVFTTNEERTKNFKGKFEVPLGQVASVGTEGSLQSKSTFTQNHLLKVQANAVRLDPMLPAGKTNGVYWVIKAADKEQGIGDSFTVALLIRRPSGSSFHLKAEGRGKLGTFSEAVARITSKLKARQRSSFRLTTLPLDRVPARIPAGVRTDNLHRASTDNILRLIPEVGLHLPELARPVTTETETCSNSSTTADLANVFGSNVTPAEAGGGDDGGDEGGDDGGDEGEGEDEVKDEDEANDGGDDNTDSADPAEEASVLATALSGAQPVVMIGTTNSSATEATTTTTTTTNTMPLSAPDRNGFTHCASSPGQTDPALAATLALILQEVRQLSPLADRQQGHGQGGSSPVSSASPSALALLTEKRIQRLRETARLYERLAELHREEAQELMTLQDNEAGYSGVAPKYA